MRYPTSPHNKLHINLDALRHNFQLLKARAPESALLAGVVKADAYGHGLLPVAQTLCAAGIDGLAVVALEEAKALRRAKIDKPIFLLMGAEPRQAHTLLSLNLIPVTDDFKLLQALSRQAGALGRPAVCQIKIDTGMKRLGLDLAQALPWLQEAFKLPHLHIIGLASHLAQAGEADTSRSTEQAGLFYGLLEALNANNLVLRQNSLLNTGGLLCPPTAASRPGWVRLGIGLYGGCPDSHTQSLVELRAVMSFTSRLKSVRRIKAGEPVSYGATWRAPEDTWLGVVPVGYADGYLRSCSNQAFMLVEEQMRPVAGRVCMNMTMLDLGPEQPPKANSLVTLLGSQGQTGISADRLGQWAHTISYEIMCSLGAANERRYQPD